MARHVDECRAAARLSEGQRLQPTPWEYEVHQLSEGYSATAAPTPVALTEPNGLANLRAIMADKPFMNSVLTVAQIEVILENKGGFMPDEAVMWFRECDGKVGPALTAPDKGGPDGKVRSGPSDETLGGFLDYVASEIEEHLTPSEDREDFPPDLRDVIHQCREQAADLYARSVAENDPVLTAPPGWKLVPSIPTPDMLMAAYHLERAAFPAVHGPKKIYETMVEAAPPATPKDAER